jgi:hypothetical protein
MNLNSSERHQGTCWLSERHSHRLPGPLCLWTDPPTHFQVAHAASSSLLLHNNTAWRAVAPAGKALLGQGPCVRHLGSCSSLEEDVDFPPRGRALSNTDAACEGCTTGRSCCLTQCLSPHATKLLHCSSIVLTVCHQTQHHELQASFWGQTPTAE